MLASSSDEAGPVLSDGSVPAEEKPKPKGRAETNGEKRSEAAPRPALLSMRLSETETSEDEAKFR